MSRRQDSITYMLVHDLPWWVSALLAGVVYILMRWVVPAMATDSSVLQPIIKALPSVAWMGAGLMLMLAGLNLYVKLLKRVFQRAPGTQPEKCVGGPTTRRDGGAAPPCPACGGSMVNRKAKRGPNTGKHFWGCARHPACNETLPQ